MARLSAAILAVLASVAAGVQQADLAAWLYSPKGFNSLKSEADTIAALEYAKLSKCRVNVVMLQTLKDVLYSPSGLNLMMSEVKTNLFPLAYQHVDPNNLVALYQFLYSPSGADVFSAAAKASAMDLARRKVTTTDMAALWSVLFGISGVNLLRSDAQKWVVDLAAAGANPAKLLASFKANAPRMTKDAAFKAAIADAVDANLFGLQTRFAKDMHPYVALEFQNYYHDTWLVEWLAAPEEKRVAQDGHDYSAAEFAAFYGGSWNTKWAASPISEQKRIDATDGKTYTMLEFLNYYHDAWQQQFLKAAEIADECAFLNQAGCTALPKCQWKFTGDWTESCVVKGMVDDLLVV